ncbi:MAG TPA: carbon-nitrogen hydrolase family protein [Hyphomicrobiales bacterium]|nr:carbon-nitrogen hydrolase family protein [Hyphomicrobiales bacterium]
MAQLEPPHDRSAASPPGQRHATLARPVRVGCVQWQMRHFNSQAAFLQHVEGFVASLASYRCDAALFPEFFNAPLMALTPGLDTLQAMRELASHTQPIVEAVTRMAVSYGIDIIAGSMPVLEEGDLYNVAFLCRRDGSVDTQHKLHPTPGEQKDWNMRGGSRLRAFDTAFGRIGILICYDVEFPELPRLLCEEGIQILFVPFWTDTKNGYLRVRLCAQARAIENECYVALAGSVGNFPQVDCLDIQYGQSAVFTPSDFGFPHDAIVSQAEVGQEMSLIVDLDLDKLDRVREAGSVRNWHDRRRDLYRLQWLGKN